MPIFNIESFKSGTTPAKAIFSASLAMFLYAEDLETLLNQDLEIFVFLTSILFFIFSIFKFVEGMIQLGIFIVVDRKTPKTSFTLWETLNQPQWEEFLVNTVSDLYLIGAFLLLFFRIEDFIEALTQILWVALPNYLPQIVIVILIIAVSTRLGYRIYTKMRIIILSMQFLTLVKLGGNYPKDLETHLVNRSWPLFKKQLIDHYIKYNHLSTDFAKRFLNRLNEEPENTNWFNAIEGELSNLNQNLSEAKIYRLNFLNQFSFYPTLTGLMGKSSIIKYVNHELNKQSVSYNVINAFIGPNPEWGRIGDPQRSQILEIIRQVTERNHLEYEIDEDWVKDFYKRLHGMIGTLNQFNSSFENFLRNYV